MFYYSELKGKKVYTSRYKVFGKVADCIFIPTEAPVVTKLIIKHGTKRLCIPIGYFSELDKPLAINGEFQQVEKTNNELSIEDKLLDEQIIDVKGEKVVRVNDIAIQRKEDNSYYIAGVDVGFRAVLRWVKLEKPIEPFYKIIGIYTSPHLLSWADIEPLELRRGSIQLRKDSDELEKMRPEDLADYLEKMNIKNINEIVENLNTKFAAEVVADLNVNYQTTLFKKFASEKGAKLVEHLDLDEAVDILLALSKEKRGEILELVPDKKRYEIKELMKLSKTPIGELINSEFLTVSAEDTVGQALGKVKNTVTNSYFSAYVYVLNNNEELVGSFDLVKLINESHDTPIYNIMGQDVVVIHLTTPKEIATKKLLRYKLFALPVIEGNKRMIGVVSYDDLIEDVLEQL